jgi:hypothetical protein
MSVMGETETGKHSELLNGERRTRLEQRAEAVRSRLEHRLDALDERREHLMDLAKKATHPPVSIVLIGAAAVVGAVVVVQQLRQRRPSRGQRFGAALLGVPARKPESFLAQAFKRAALALVASLVQRVGTRGLDRLLPEAPAPALPEVPRPRAL